MSFAPFQAGEELTRQTFNERFAAMLTDQTAAIFGLGTNATPDQVFAAVGNDISGVTKAANNGWKKIQEYTTAGSYTWTAPNLFGGRSYVIGVAVIGGGGSGGAAVYTGANQSRGTVSATGGGSGEANYFLMTVTPGATYRAVVGSGGSAATRTTGGGTNGNDAGTSSFNGKTAAGGQGGAGSGGHGSSDGDYLTEGPRGGQGATGASESAIRNSSDTPYGGVVFETNGGTRPLMCVNPFEIVPVLAAGGCAYAKYQAGGYGQQGSVTLPGGKTSAGVGYATTSTSASRSAAKGTLPGCGGGACAVEVYNSSVSTSSATSAAGNAGAVKIYALGAVQ